MYQNQSSGASRGWKSECQVDMDAACHTHNYFPTFPPQPSDQRVGLLKALRQRSAVSTPSVKYRAAICCFQ